MKAPAKAVAALRIGVRVEYMVASLFVVEPDHRVHATYIAGSVPNWNYCLFSVSLLAASQEKPAIHAVIWEFSPIPVAETLCPRQ